MCKQSLNGLVRYISAFAILGSYILFNSAIIAYASSADIRYGRYLVTRVAMCADCHTPKDTHGQPILSRWLQGSPIDFKPLHPVPGWADHAPAIAGLPHGWTKQQMIHFLETNLKPNGKHPRPPMPMYMMRPKDARAVTLYLESLKRKHKGK